MREIIYVISKERYNLYLQRLQTKRMEQVITYFNRNLGLKSKIVDINFN